MQTLSLQAIGQLTGGPLCIPASKIFDTVPTAVHPTDFLFRAQDLTAYIQEYWSQLVVRDRCRCVCVCMVPAVLNLYVGCRNEQLITHWQRNK